MDVCENHPKFKPIYSRAGAILNAEEYAKDVQTSLEYAALPLARPGEALMTSNHMERNGVKMQKTTLDIGGRGADLGNG